MGNCMRKHVVKLLDGFGDLKDEGSLDKPLC